MNEENTAIDSRQRHDDEQNATPKDEGRNPTRQTGTFAVVLIWHRCSGAALTATDQSQAQNLDQDNPSHRPKIRQRRDDAERPLLTNP